MNVTKLSTHATHRLCDRSIPQMIIEALLDFGERLPSYDATLIRWSKKAWREYTREVGRAAASHLVKFRGAAIVVSRDETTVITVMWLH